MLFLLINVGYFVNVINYCQSQAIHNSWIWLMKLNVRDFTPTDVARAVALIENEQWANVLLTYESRISAPIQ